MPDQNLDIEHLLQWAYAQTVYVRYGNASGRSLEFNHGYSAIPRGCHGSFAGGDVGVVLCRDGAIDAKRIIEAVDELDPWSRSIVIRCAKSGTRPDCMIGVEPKLVPKYRRCRKKHRRVKVASIWEPCSPKAICAAREIYARWHTVLGRLAEHLTGELNDCDVIGFSASAAPWEAVEQQAA